MAGFGFGNVGFVGSLKPGVVAVVDYLIAPFSVSQDSQFLRVTTAPDRPVVNLVTLAGNDSWTRETVATYDGGSGCYMLTTGKGYTFKIRGSNFKLEGIYGDGPSTNNFSVSIDGVAAGGGSNYAPGGGRGTYYAATGLTNTIHTVVVLKTETLLFLDTVSAV